MTANPRKRAIWDGERPGPVSLHINGCSRWALTG